MMILIRHAIYNIRQLVLLACLGGRHEAQYTWVMQGPLVGVGACRALVCFIVVVEAYWRHTSPAASLTPTATAGCV